MKKKFLLLLTMICFIFSFTACRAEEEPIEEQNQPIEQEQQVDPGNDGNIDENIDEGNPQDDTIENGENVTDEAEDAIDNADDAMQEAGDRTDGEAGNTTADDTNE